MRAKTTKYLVLLIAIIFSNCSKNKDATPGSPTPTASWNTLGFTLGGTVRSIAVYDGKLYIGISDNTGPNLVAMLNGSTWSTPGTGIPNLAGSGTGGVYAMITYNNNLCVGGAFSISNNDPGNSIAVWDTSSWSTYSSGFTGAGSLPAPLSALAVYNGTLIAGGVFTAAGGNAATNVAIWNGTSWSGLGIWGNGSGNIYALAMYNGNLYAAGSFSNAGGTGANNIAMWNGSAWSALGSGINGLAIYSLVVYNNNLYVGGEFSNAGGISASNIAMWNGTTWSAVSSGVNGMGLTSMTTNNGDLYVGGNFTTAGGISATNVAQWNGTTWSALGSGISWINGVCALGIYNGHVIAGGSGGIVLWPN